MKSCISEYLVSPASGLPLKDAGAYLMTEGGAERFEINNGIACLLDAGRLDRFKKNEMEIFDSLKIQGIPYFRNTLFKKIVDKIIPMIAKNSLRHGGHFGAVEMGGGEGHWARVIKEGNPSAEVFICDLSMNMLGRSPQDLKRVCADVTRPIFRKNSITLASFWVSLHHLSPADRVSALWNAVDSLEDEGVLLIFEPNDAFFPRKMIYDTTLRKDVYPDEHEQAINFSGISQALNGLGLAEEGLYFINPPYNPDFVRKLKKWAAYMTAVESLYQLDRWMLDPVFGDIFSAKQSRLKRYLSLYGLAVYRKKSAG